MPLLSAAQVAAYDRDGVVLVEDLFTPAELAPLLRVLDDGSLDGISVGRSDAAGQPTRLLAWPDLPDNEAGALAGSERLVSCARILLREDVYHWHSKVMLKVPGSPGQWEWHQDYGYWYANGCLYPRMLSAMVVLDSATRENGCLKVLEGSHLLGRLDHEAVGEQEGADPERVRHLESTLPVRYLEAGPGSVIFFHCNTLHSSEPNLSQGPRRAMITAYNALSNVPIGNRGHGRVRELVTAAALT